MRIPAVGNVEIEPDPAAEGLLRALVKAGEEAGVGYGTCASCPRIAPKLITYEPAALSARNNLLAFRASEHLQPGNGHTIGTQGAVQIGFCRGLR
jgi:hypothetical protein